MHDRHEPTDLHVRTTLPREWGRRLTHLAADLGVPKHELLREAVLLLLGHHGRAEALPEPMAPARTDGKVAP